VSTYVYAITRTSHPLKVDGRTGVGEKPAPLRTVRTDDLAAVVSDAPPNLRAKRRDIEAHETVMEELISDGAVLPMRFGLIAGDDADVERALAENTRPYGALLADLAGKVEMNVKATHREDAVLGEILRADDDLRQDNDALRAAGGGDHADRLAFGERVSAALEQRRSADAERLLALLRPHADRERLGPPVEGAFLNVSFLVDPASRAELEATIARLRTETRRLMELNVYGPLPPYSFVDVAPYESEK
jgi:hypothetical protein